MKVFRAATVAVLSVCVVAGSAVSASAVTDGPEVDHDPVVVVPVGEGRSATVNDGPELDGGRVITVMGAEGIGFASPTGNIGCYMSDSQASCYIAHRTWKAPVPPASGVPGVKPADLPYVAEVSTFGKGNFSYGEMNQSAWAFSQIPGDAASKPSSIRWFNPKLDVTTKAGGDPQGFPVAGLGYGSSIIFGVFRCDSAKTGVTCTNTKTKHGFSYARAGYKFF